MSLWRAALFVMTVFAPAILATGEQWPTFSVTRRVFQIRVGSEYGSSFTIERNGKQYLVTARHLVQGLPKTRAHVEVFKGGLWRPMTVDIIYPASPDVDVVALRLPEDLSNRYENELAGTVTIGQEAYFLGFPYGLHTLVGGESHPFEKHAYLSAIDNLDPHAPIFYLDGFNNPGFSGGPVVFYDYKASRWTIVAVVSGFRNAQAQVRVGGKLQDTTILVNSGIILAFPLQAVLEAIDDASRGQ